MYLLRQIIAAALLAVAVTASESLDFTPHWVNSFEDGFTVRRMFFLRGARQRIFYAPPRNWLLTGHPDLFTIMSKEIPDARALLSISPIEKPLPFDEKNLPDYRKSVLSLAPASAERAVITGEQPKAERMNGWQAHEFYLAFNYAGRAWMKSALFITLKNGQQILLVIEAPKEEFEKFYTPVRKSIHTWTEELPSAPASPDNE